MVSFCNPGVLGSPAQFRRHFEAPILAGREPGKRLLVLQCMAPAQPSLHGKFQMVQWAGKVACWLLRHCVHFSALLLGLPCPADASEEEVQLCQERTAELSALVNEFILRKKGQRWGANSDLLVDAAGNAAGC